MKLELVIVIGFAVSSIHIAPPFPPFVSVTAAVLFINFVFVTVKLLSFVYIAPPSPSPFLGVVAVLLINNEFSIFIYVLSVPLLQITPP